MMGIIVYFFARGEWYWICDISQPESPYAGDSLPGKCNAYATPRGLNWIRQISVKYISTTTTSPRRHKNYMELRRLSRNGVNSGELLKIYFLRVNPTNWYTFYLTHILTLYLAFYLTYMLTFYLFFFGK